MSTVSAGDYICLRTLVRIEGYNKTYKYFTIGLVVDGFIHHTLSIPIYLNKLQIFPPEQQWIMPVKHLYLPGHHAYVVDSDGDVIINNIKYKIHVSLATFRMTGNYELISVNELPQKTMIMKSTLMSKSNASILIEKQVEKVLAEGQIDGNLIWGRIVKIFVDARDEYDNKLTHIYSNIALASTRDTNVTYLIEDPITLSMFFVPARYCILI